MSDADFAQLTSSYALSRTDYMQLRDILDGFPEASPLKPRLAAVLDQVQRQAAGSFSMVLWCGDDCYQGVAWALAIEDSDWSLADDLPLGVPADVVAEVARRSRGPIVDAMTEAGWDVIRWVAREVLNERGLLAAAEPSA